jgi:ribosomal-protein-alanine N-acetyltransferase
MTAPRLRGEIWRSTFGRPDARWLRALSRLERICYPPGVAYSRATLVEWMSEPDTLVLGLWQDGETLAATQISDLTEGHLITLDVHPDHRRRGLGRRLLRATLGLQRRWGGHDAVLCEIAVDNEPSLQLHEGEGFVILCRMEEYYENGTDAFVLGRRLD